MSQIIHEGDEDYEEAESSSSGGRGPYRPSVIGFVAEYHADAPLSPLQYSSLVPDLVLSYSSDAATHFDLVILRFGRSEKTFEALADALKAKAGLSVQDIKVFRNGKTSNRLQYLKRVIFPRMGSKHHGLRKWSLTEAAQQCNGMDAFLNVLEESDVTQERWSVTQKRRTRRLLSKYSLVFAP